MLFRYRTLCASAVSTILPVLALAEPAMAQTAGDAGRRLRISPQVQVVHDSNVLRLPDNVPALNGRRSDLIVTPQVALDINLPTGRTTGFLSGVIGYDFHRNNKQFDRERIALSGGAVTRVSTCDLTTSLGYTRQQSDPADIFFRDGGRISQRNTETRVSPFVSIGCGRTSGVTSLLSYQGERVTNSAEQRLFGNYRASTFSARVGLARPTLGEIGLYSSYRRAEYDNRFLFNQPDVVDVYSAGVRVERQLGQIRGSASLGYTRVDSRLSDDFSGLSYDLALSSRVGARLRSAIGFSRSVEQSNILGVSYSISDRYSGRLDYALSPRLRVFADAVRLERRFDRPALGFLGGRALDDKTDNVTLGASVSAARRIGVDVGATLLRRRSDEPLFNYNARRLFVTLRYN